MIKNVKIILIGGSPMSGKSTLARKIACKYAMGNISTDDIGEILQINWDINPMKEFNYQDYYTKKQIKDLTEEAYEYHKNMVPAILKLIEIHSTWGNPAVIEGWALYPNMVKGLEKGIKKLWLISDEALLRKRLDDEAQK